MKGFFESYICFLLIFAGLVPQSIHKAWAAQEYVATYDVYASGFHALDATLTITRQDNRAYIVDLTSATHGLLGSLAPWEGRFTTHGWKSKDGQFHPREHITSSTWKKETEIKSYTYDKNGNFKGLKVEEGGKDKTPDDLDLSLTIGTKDILSATLGMMENLKTTKTCASKDLIFDGDRNFYLLFSGSTTENMSKTKYNIFDGTAITCTVEVKPEKGKWRKKPRGWLSIQEQGRQLGALPKVWFGEAGGAKAPFIPVKIQVKTDYGVLFMHLTSYKERQINAGKLTKLPKKGK